MKSASLPEWTKNIPSLKEGWSRWIHITSDWNLDSIRETGLRFAQQGMLSSTACCCGSKEVADNYLHRAHTDRAFDDRFKLIPGRVAIVLDLPERLSRIADLRDAEFWPSDTIDPQFIRAVVHGDGMKVTDIRESPQTWVENFERRKGPSVSHTLPEERSAAVPAPSPRGDDGPLVW
jgi:hypothetical protein